MIVVAWNDNKVYPPAESSHRLPANAKYKSVKRETFCDMGEAIKFYMRKFYEIHPEIKEVLR